MDIQSNRIRNILQHLSSQDPRIQFTWCSAEQYTAVSIDGVRIPVSAPKHIEKVYHQVGPSWVYSELPELLGHMKWFFQKTQLNQDMFLIGPPGPLRRWLAFYYCSLTQREAEYLALSRDTTESDIKQRREIKNKTVIYVDQAAVNAAIHGRVLILEGIEKCERNVLNVLNNLLENREMSLEDGRFLIPSTRYVRLLETHSRAELDALKLVEVSSDFRVIALGLPVPTFQGFPLDPPLRSRFQARNIPFLGNSTLISLLKNMAPHLSQEFLTKLVGFAAVLTSIHYSDESKTLTKLLHFPFLGLFHIASLLQLFPKTNPRLVLARVFPFQIIAEKSENDAVGAALRQIGLANFDFNTKLDQTTQGNKFFDLYLDDTYRFPKIEKGDLPDTLRLTFDPLYGPPSSEPLTIFVSGGRFSVMDIPPEKEIPFVPTLHLEQFMVCMFHEHAAGFDMCLIGDKGCGKSAIIHQWAKLLQYNIRTIQLYRDMTERDLLQRRTTTENGDTIWIYSPLVIAAIKGDLAVLDGIDRLAPGVLATLQRLVVDREVTLGDGTTLIRWDRYETMVEQIRKETEDHSMAIESLTQKKIHPVSPHFRIICTALPPARSGTKAWLTDEIVSMFHFHVLQNNSDDFGYASTVLKTLFPSLKDSVAKLLHQLMFNFTKKGNSKIMEKSGLENDTGRHGMPTLSLRQLIRICRRVEHFEEDLALILEDTFMFRFLPEATKDAVVSLLASMKIILPSTQPEKVSTSVPLEIKIDEYQVDIGGIRCNRRKPDHPALVPQIRFFPVPQHISLLREMLKSFILGEHLLLIGNQGVGKNVLTDRLLELLCCEREYIQLHRDTTVQSLTLYPEIKHGILVWEDSPLIKAVKKGRVLVVDEADKAPLEVTVILKGLVADGEMILSDGRRILREWPSSPVIDQPEDTEVIKMHKDFRLIVLANRPGYPFQGNNFFRECGDCFACHVIDNPDKQSFIKMLAAYGPNVPLETLEGLTALFIDLRELVDKGELTYPYSLRELVQVVKHLSSFPSDPVASALQNVFHFDAYDKDLNKQISDLFFKHGFPMGHHYSVAVSLAQEKYLAAAVATEHWRSLSLVASDFLAAPNREKKTMPIHCLVMTLEIIPKAIWSYSSTQKNLEQKRMVRIQTFTEEKFSWKVNGGKVLGMAITETTDQQSIIHVLTSDPLTIQSYLPAGTLEQIDLQQHIPSALVTSVPPHIAACANSLIVHFPACNMLFLVTLGGKPDIFVYEIPSIFDNKGEIFGAFGSKIFIKKERQRELYFGLGRSQIMTMKGIPSESTLVFSSPYNNRFCLVELGQGNITAQIVTAPDWVFESIHPINSSTWLMHNRLGDKAYGVWESHKPSFTLIPISRQFPPDNEHGNYSKYVHTEPNTEPLLLNSRQTHVQKRIVRALDDEGPLQPGTIYHTIFSYKRNAIDHSIPVQSLFVRKTNHFVNVVFEEIIDVTLGDYIARDLPRPKKFMLEFIDLSKETIRVVPIPSAGPVSPLKDQNQFLKKNIDQEIIAVGEASNGDVVTLSSEGELKLWQTDRHQLEEDLKRWRELSSGGDGLLKGHGITFEFKKSGPTPPIGTPVMGKLDPTGAPHVGGNQWAGGSGGSTTAGLGGVGGPFRLDSGNPVYQISQKEKEKISAEEEAMRREISKAALAERLNALNLNEMELEKYEFYHRPVVNEIGQLRAILEATQAKNKERTWLKQKSQGELDDTRLVEGITGDSRIYKKRGKQDIMQGGFQEKPKRFSFVMDVSGSMYRFNSQDHRLDRLLQVTVMIMEALEGFQHKFTYEIVGHSGDSPEIPLVPWEKPASSVKDRLLVCEKMIAHSQYCASGDFTLEATTLAISRVIQEEADDHFVFVFSDANLARYGISTSELSKDLLQEPRVNACVIFIASTMNEAERLKRELPLGKAFICLNPQDLPHTFKQILSQSVKDD